jgi:hypothetical protein
LASIGDELAVAVLRRSQIYYRSAAMCYINPMSGVFFCCAADSIQHHENIRTHKNICSRKNICSHKDIFSAKKSSYSQ